MKYDLAHLENKQLYLFGLGAEGYSTYNFLRKHFPEKKLILVDDNPPEKLSTEWQAVTQNPYSTMTTADTFGERDLSKAVLFKSPGIPPAHPLLKEALENNVTITSNTNLFFQLTPSITIGITGTKGKSTTAAVVHHVLSKAGKDVVLGGNIGVPPLDLLTNQPAKIAVLELSSHQLRDLTLSPHFAIIQNITPEHLDYYPSFEEYTTAKARITRFQTQANFVLYNPLFRLPREIAQKSQANKLPFGSKQADDSIPLAYVANNAIYYQEEKVIELDELTLKGEHNIQNILPAVVIARQLSVSVNSIREGLLSFAPLSHRLEEVATKNSITFVNDSLSTTPEATIAALHSYAPRPIVLIAGGYEREQNFATLATEISRHNVQALLYFNPTGERLAKSIKKFTNRSNITMEEVLTMEEAVAKAVAVATKNTVVLLSPASASFGQFKDYQDRGNQFKDAVMKLSLPNQ